MHRLSAFRPARALAWVVGLWALLLLVPARSYAYLDPGTGSYALQLALALVLGAAFTGKVYWRKIKAFVVRKFGKRE